MEDTADTLSDIKLAVAKMETKLDEVIKRLDPVVVDHEQRLRVLEAKVLRWSGMATAIGAVLGTAGGAVLSQITGGGG